MEVWIVKAIVKTSPELSKSSLPCLGKVSHIIGAERYRRHRITRCLQINQSNTAALHHNHRLLILSQRPSTRPCHSSNILTVVVRLKNPVSTAEVERSVLSIKLNSRTVEVRNASNSCLNIIKVNRDLDRFLGLLKLHDNFIRSSIFRIQRNNKKSARTSEVNVLTIRREHRIVVISIDLRQVRFLTRTGVCNKNVVARIPVVISTSIENFYKRNKLAIRREVVLQ